MFDDAWSSGRISLDYLLGKVLDNCIEWFEASSASLFLRQGNEEYRLAVQSGPKAKIPVNTVLVKGVGIAGEAIRKGKPILVHNPAELGLKGRRGSGSAIVVPLKTPESGCIGVLNVYRTEVFVESDLKSATTLARYIALAVNNAQLMSAMNLAVEKAVAVSEELDAILENLGVGVLVVSDTGEIQAWNPEAKAILGDLYDNQNLAFLSEEKLSLKKSLLEAFKQGSKDGRASSNAFEPETEQSWSLIAAKLPSGGMTITIHETTEREKAFRELARTRRLAEVGQMTAAIAHEIRNPLTGIRSAAQMAQTLSEEAHEFGKIIEEEALKLNALCDQFLEFAKPINLNTQEINLSALIEKTLKLYQAEIEQSGVLVRLIPEVECPIIQGDSLKVEQILRNLVLNALQACSEGDEVAIIWSEKAINICDTGSGMNPDQVSNLFTPFFTTKPKGTGLGLSTVKKIIDAHGWNISVRSQLNEGTTFSIEFAKNLAA